MMFTVAGADRIVLSLFSVISEERPLDNLTSFDITIYQDEDDQDCCSSVKFSN